MDESWKPQADAAMARYACGDDPAFERLYDLLAPRLHAFLFRRTGDAARADDLLQQTFLQIHCARQHFSPGAAVMPWAFAIARRLLIDGHRQMRRSLITEASADAVEACPSNAEHPDGLVAKRRLAARFQEEFCRVSDPNRVAFELVRLDGMSMSEAAQTLGTTVTAVKLRVFRAAKTLRERLGPALNEELAET